MSIQNTAETENRTLGKFIKAKLDISLAEFARCECTPVSTLNDRWRSAAGKVRIMDAAWRFYSNRYGDL